MFATTQEMIVVRINLHIVLDTTVVQLFNISESVLCMYIIVGKSVNDKQSAVQAFGVSR